MRSPCLSQARRIDCPSYNPGPSIIGTGLAIALAFALGSVASAVAQTNETAEDWIGHFRSAKGKLTLVVQKGSSSNNISVKLRVRSGGCSGDASGSAKIVSSDTLRVSIPVTNGKCVIKFWYEGPDSIKISENDGCQDLHGVACDFNGRVER